MLGSPHMPAKASAHHHLGPIRTTVSLMRGERARTCYTQNLRFPSCTFVNFVVIDFETTKDTKEHEGNRNFYFLKFPPITERSSSARLRTTSL